jgi:thiamine kinase-like enzyme
LENQFAAWLASQNMAPKVYGRFLNGRVEEFYDRVRPLQWKEMKDYSPQIAPQMAALHQLSSLMDASGNNVVLPKPTIKEATVYETIDKWLQQAKAQKLQQQKQQQRETNGDDDTDDHTKFLEELQSEWIWLEEQLSKPLSSTTDNDDHKNDLEAQAYAFIRRVTVTHMDCQPLNILIDDTTNNGAGSSSSSNNNNNHNHQHHEDDNSDNDDHSDDDDDDNDDDGPDSTIRLRLIDFEYSGWNPVAADIANTFCEYCEMSNLRANYDQEYPTPQQQDEFFWHYCRQYIHNNHNDQEFKMFLQQVQNNKDDWKIFSQALQREVGRFSLLSHLGWAIWSLLKANEEDGVDFDYMYYARHRMEGYEWAKNKFFSFNSSSSSNQ